MAFVLEAWRWRPLLCLSLGLVRIVVSLYSYDLFVGVCAIVFFFLPWVKMERFSWVMRNSLSCITTASLARDQQRLTDLLKLAINLLQPHV